MIIQKIEKPEELIRLQNISQSNDIRPYEAQNTCTKRLNMYALDIYIVLDDSGMDCGYFIVHPLTEVSCEIHVGFLKSARKNISMSAGAEILRILATQYKVCVGMIASKNKAALHYATLHNFVFCGIIKDAVELISGQDDLIIMQKRLS